MSIWETGLIWWNPRRIDADAVDRNLLLCGACLPKYRTLRQFCSICLRTYAVEEEPMVIVDPVTVDSKLQSDSNNNTNELIESKVETSEEKNLSLVDDKNELDDNYMVLCNECDRWVHAACEGLDQSQYNSITSGTHPIWVTKISTTNTQIIIFVIRHLFFYFFFFTIQLVSFMK